GVIFNVPISVSVPAGTLELVMEVMNPDGVAAGNNFFIGSNTSAETGTSYLSSVPCGLPDPTPTDGIIPGLIMHIVYNVDGSCPGGTPTPAPTPRSTPSPRPRPTPHPRP